MCCPGVYYFKLNQKSSIHDLHIYNSSNPRGYYGQDGVYRFLKQYTKAVYAGFCKKIHNLVWVFIPDKNTQSCIPLLRNQL